MIIRIRTCTAGNKTQLQLNANVTATEVERVQ